MYRTSQTDISTNNKTSFSAMVTRVDLKNVQTKGEKAPQHLSLYMLLILALTATETAGFALTCFFRWRSCAKVVSLGSSYTPPPPLKSPPVGVETAAWDTGNTK